MIENSESLLPRGNIKAVTLGVDEESLSEMDRLLETLGVQIVGKHCAPIRRIQAGTYFGTGKLQEVKAQSPDAEVLILDVELTPKQMQNIEKIFQLPVLDRAGVILEIFSRHARTREAKTQVELAKLQYILPRLVRLWSHFERQRGGGGGGGAANRGMGEKQIEVDRRLVKRRIGVLKQQLLEIEKERRVQRGSRNHLLKVALVGYTNAGKSTLLNALTESRVLAEDKLFATLDATVRALNPDSHPPVVAIDTVGFIQNIPTSLIASFKSTLEEIREADLIVHVVDASSDRAREQYETTVDVLKELECDQKESMVVLNKMDLVQGAGKLNLAKTIVPGATRISALDIPAVRELRDRILDHFRKKMKVWDLVIPYSEGKLLAKLQQFGSVQKTRYLDKGIFLQVKLESSIGQKLGIQRYAMEPEAALE